MVSEAVSEAPNDEDVVTLEVTVEDATTEADVVIDEEVETSFVSDAEADALPVRSSENDAVPLNDALDVDESLLEMESVGVVLWEGLYEMDGVGDALAVPGRCDTVGVREFDKETDDVGDEEAELVASKVGVAEDEDDPVGWLLEVNVGDKDSVSVSLGDTVSVDEGGIEEDGELLSDLDATMDCEKL